MPFMLKDSTLFRHEPSHIRLEKRNLQSWPITYDLFSFVRQNGFLWLVPSNLPYMLIVQLHTQIHKSIVPVAPFCIYSSLTMTARLTREMLVLSPRTRFRSTAHRHSSEICIRNVSSPRDLDLIMLRRHSPLCKRVVFPFKGYIDWIILCRVTRIYQIVSVVHFDERITDISTQSRS